MVWTPPRPAPMYTPQRSASASGSRGPSPASATAVTPAATPNCRKRSRCLSSRLSKNDAGFQPLTSQENFVAKFVVSNSVVGAAPLLPAIRPDHVASRSLPIGVIRPMPVMTTRRRESMTVLYRTLARRTATEQRARLFRVTVAVTVARVALDVVDRVLDGLDLLGVFLGDRDLELLLEREHELDHGERVRLEIVDERRLGPQLLGGHLELVADDFLDLGLDLFRRHGSSWVGPGCRVDSPDRALHQHPAVDPQHLAGDVRGLWSGQECRDVRDVLGPADLAQRDRLEQLGPLGLGEVLGGHVGLDVARRDRVARDAARRELPGGRHREPDQAGLGRRVRGLTRIAAL